MDKVALITGADRGLGYGLCASLLRKGWRVLAGQYMPDWPELNELARQNTGSLFPIPLDVTSIPSLQEAARKAAVYTGHIDLLINNAGVTSPTTRFALREALDYGEMQRIYDTNSLGPLRVVEAFLSLTDQGELRRLCFVSSEAGSIRQAARTGWFGYCMSKSALNMAVKLMFNQLHPEGYTFRLYHPGWMKTYMGGKKNMDATLEIDEAADKAVSFFLRKRNEDRLVLVDYAGRTWPW
jgi:NAD(P)-dependent dehydrogenase (short-subunit alcohol dehydrogenase family)